MQVADIRAIDKEGCTAFYWFISTLHKYPPNADQLKQAIDITGMFGSKEAFVANRESDAYNMCALKEVRKMIEDYTPSLKIWKWEFDSSQLDNFQDLPNGSGRFGTVSVAEWNGVPVAIKRLHKDNNDLLLRREAGIIG